MTEVDTFIEPVEVIHVDPPPFIHLEIHSTVPLKQAAADGVCHHPSVDFSKPQRHGNATHLDCVCLCCDLRWVSVKVHEPVKPSDRKAAVDGE